MEDIHGKYNYMKGSRSPGYKKGLILHVVYYLGAVIDVLTEKVKAESSSVDTMDGSAILDNVVSQVGKDVIANLKAVSSFSTVIRMI